MQQNIARLDKKELLISVGIFALALFVRLFYLYESSANPSFTTPTIDSGAYDMLARSVAQGKGMSSKFFWQPFFYPAFLSAIYLAGNSSIICAKLVQLLLGCVTCLLTYRLGKGIFDRPAGIIAGVMTALYGPLVFFEAELLAAGWAAFWSIVLVLLFIKSASKKSGWLCVVLGICGALSIITRPTFIPFFTAAVVWLAVIFCRAGDGWRRIALSLGAVLTGFLLIAIPVAAQNFRVTGHFGFLPASGGINLYIGNNPNYSETVIARPGCGWREILDLPKRNGVIGDRWEQQKFFKQKVVNYVLTEPLGFLRGLAYKTVQFLNSREIPRNVDVYLFGKWSRLLDLLTWKVVGFGFPFGVFLPLALLGVVSFRRQLPVPLLLFVILYPLSIILVFAAARYRVVVIPVMSVVAAAGLLNLLRMVRGLYWRRMLVISVFAVAIVLLSSLPGPFPGEKSNLEAEFYLSVATAENDQGKSKEAVKHFLEALRLKPDYAEAHNNLGLALRSQGKLDEAVSHYHQALRFKPDYALAHNNLGIALQSQGKLDEALSHFRQALQIKPDYAGAHNNLGNALQLQSRLDEAINHLRQALQIAPDDAGAHSNLGLVLARQGKLDEAITHLTEAVQLNPNFASAHYNLARALAKGGKTSPAIKHLKEALQLKPDWVSPMNSLAWLLATHHEAKFRNPGEAIRLAERVCELTNYDDAGFVDTLAVAYAAGGRFPDAVSAAEKAVRLAAGSKERSQKIQKRLELYKAGQAYYEPSPVQDNPP